jgi:hypothetical protein
MSSSPNSFKRRRQCAVISKSDSMLRRGHYKGEAHHGSFLHQYRPLVSVARSRRRAPLHWELQRIPVAPPGTSHISAPSNQCAPNDLLFLAGSGQDRDEAHYSPFGCTVSGSANVGGCVYSRSSGWPVDSASAPSLVQRH